MERPEIGIVWPGLEGLYDGTASAGGYTVNGQPLIMSEKDQLWPAFQVLR